MFYSPKPRSQVRILKYRNWTITAVDVQTMEDDSTNELSLGILEGHKLVVNLAKIYNRQRIAHCCCVSCAAVSRVKVHVHVQQTVEGDREISRDLTPAKE